MRTTSTNTVDGHGTRRHRRRLALLVLLIGSVVPIVSSAAPAAAACSLTERSTTETIKVDRKNRTYLLRVPAGLSGPSPLVISLHPGLVSAVDWEPLSGWNAISQSEGVIIAYPQGGLFNTWESNSPTGADYPFLMAAVEDIKSKVCVDESRVHASGYSMGGWMAQRLACQSAGTFASVGAGGAGHPEDDHWWPYQNPAWPCSPSRPISVHLAMGTDDDTTTGLNALDEWLADDNCGATPATATVPEGSEETWSCAAGTEVVWRTMTGYDHIEAVEPMAQYVVGEQWAFFTEHTLP